MGWAKKNFEVSLVEVNCGECGGTYAINERYHTQKQEKGGFWTCPYCKTGWGFGESENSRLKKQLEKAEKRRQWAENRAKREEERADHERARANGYKGAMTKTKKRIGKGVCPCCNRSFQNLKSHMENKHPDYVEEEA